MFGLTDHCAVYLPHSYNFSGQLLLVPREHVTLVQSGSAELMSFIVSGGVTDKAGTPSSVNAVISTRSTVGD